MCLLVSDTCHFHSHIKHHRIEFAGKAATLSQSMSRAIDGIFVAPSHTATISPYFFGGDALFGMPLYTVAFECLGKHSFGAWKRQTFQVPSAGEEPPFIILSLQECS